MPLYKDKEEIVRVRYVHCDKCGHQLVLKTITVYKPSYHDKDDPGISFEYFCPKCKESIFLEQEFPKILPKIKSNGKILDKR